MEDKLFIPKRIKVGYQERDDTYTKRLAYVIYYDNKNKIRKEASWLSWCQLEDSYYDNYIRDDKGQALKDADGKYIIEKVLRHKGIPADEYDNVPTEGFVLNKGVGGVKESYGWNTRNEYIRVYDPRGFEFEISIRNLLYILENSNSYKGKGLEGEFVYSWDGKDLVLLPCSTIEFQSSQEFTNLKDMKVSAKELVEGHTYLGKDTESYIYLGKYEWIKYPEWRKQRIDITKEFVFWDIKESKYVTKKATEIAKVLDANISDDFSRLAAEINDTTLINNYELQINPASKDYPLSIEYKSYSYDNELDRRMIKKGNEYQSVRLICQVGPERKENGQVPVKYYSLYWGNFYKVDGNKFEKIRDNERKYSYHSGLRDDSYQKDCSLQELLKYDFVQFDMVFKNETNTISNSIY